MRADMAKVIVERPRTGGHRSRDRLHLNKLPLEEHPSKESMLARHGDTKELNENLKPLYRWLEAQVGRNWNAVHSELRERIDVRSAVQAHIWQHAEQYVERRNVHYVGRVPHSDGRFRQGAELSQGQLYVCPKTNLVKRHGVRKRHSYARDKPQGPSEDTFRRMSPKLAYIKKYDIWYALTLTKLSPELHTVEAFGTRAEYKITTAMEDMFLNAHVRLQTPNYGKRGVCVTQCGETLRAYGDGWVYASRKRALNSTEIRQAGLR